MITSKAETVVQSIRDKKIAVQEIQEVEKGSSASVYRIVTDSETYLLKVQDFNTSRVFRAEPIIHRLMLENGVKTPEIYGSNFSHNPLGKAYILMEYIDGEHPVLNKNDEKNKDLLIKMGKIMKNITNLPLHFDSCGPIYANREHKLEVEREESWNQHVKRTGVEMIDDIEPEFSDYKDSLRDIFESVQLSEPDDLAVFHGDVRIENLLKKNNTLYILDWGRNFYGDPIYMLARSEYMLNRDASLSGREIDTEPLFHGFSVDKNLTKSLKFRLYKLHTAIVEMRMTRNWYKEEVRRNRTDEIKKFLEKEVTKYEW